MPLQLSASARSALWLAMAIAATTTAHAASPTQSTAVTTSTLQVQDVAVIAATCANCHGPDGRSTGGIPQLRGVGETHLLARMQAFKAGTAPDATVMTRLMKGYDDQQIQALAKWFSKEGK